MQIVYNKTNSFKIDDLIIKYYYTEEKMRQLCFRLIVKNVVKE